MTPTICGETHSMTDKRFKEIYDRIDLAVKGVCLTTKQGQDLIDLIKLRMRIKS